MNTNKRFAKTAKLLSVFGIMLILSSFLYAFTGAGDGDIFDLIFSSFGPILFVGLGYMIQSIVGTVTRYKRRDSHFDGDVKYVALSACIIPIVLCILCAIPLAILYRYYCVLTQSSIDIYDLSLYIPPILSAAMMILGALVWFFPYHTLIRTEWVYGYGALWLAGFIVSVVFGVSLVPITLCFTLFIGIFFTVSNLGCIEESLSASKFRVPSNNFRSYNLKLTLKHYALTLIVAVLILCLIILAVGIIQPKITPIDPESSVQEDDEVVPEEPIVSGEGVAADGFWAKLFYVRDESGMAGIMNVAMIVVTVAFAVFVLWWLYRKHLLKRFFALLILLFSSISEFFEALLQLFEGRIKVSATESYVDTEVDIDCVVEYREYKAAEVLTRQGFDAALKELSTLEEKYTYAYSVYTKLIRGHKYGIKASDTPRVLTAKLLAARKPELERATPVFEDIRYRDISPDKAVCEAELNKLAGMVRRIL
ncbi:MAG: hypothetical protein IKT46_02770 [Clostridia bacterium]|nr:hypothetical protein [Clostridia bacterium]